MNLINFLKDSINGKLSTDSQEEFLRSKSDFSPEELAKVVRFLRKQMPQKIGLKNCIDICGTGGSGLNRINTSTISAFILAAQGVKVAKHGNRAASGRFGSFDLLESLSVKVTNNIEDLTKIFNLENLVFLFAPYFHPVMKHFAEVRKKIGKPTFFNLLGPLLNPALVKRQIIGTTFKDKMGLIAQTCKILGQEKVYIVCGEDHLDEVTLTGKTFVTELNHGKIKNYTISPKDFGIKKSTFAEIQGGNADINTKIALEIMAGKCATRHLDLVLINAALGFLLADKVKTLKEGYKKAFETIKQGKCSKKFQEYKTISKTSGTLLAIVENKKAEVEKRKTHHQLGRSKVSKRDFISAITSHHLALIAEIKRHSPSLGNIQKGNFSPIEIAKEYEKSGASAISVVCDKKYFHGDLKYLKEVSANTNKIPLLCKDFIIDEFQIHEAREYGADAILLISAILTEAKLQKFINLAESLKMAVLCEVHTLEDLEKVLKTSAKIIGINNRNLNTLQIDLNTTQELAKHIPKDKIIVSESGINSKEDVEKLPKNINAILVGTSLMKGTKISQLINN